MFHILELVFESVLFITFFYLGSFSRHTCASPQLIYQCLSFITLFVRDYGNMVDVVEKPQM